MFLEKHGIGQVELVIVARILRLGRADVFRDHRRRQDDDDFALAILRIFVAEQLASTTADMASGVFSVGALIDSASAMRALTERGVHAAMFEGAPIS